MKAALKLSTWFCGKIDMLREKYVIMDLLVTISRKVYTRRGFKGFLKDKVPRRTNSFRSRCAVLLLAFLTNRQKWP